MKNILTAILLLFCHWGFSQNDSILKYISQLEGKRDYKKDTNYIFALNKYAESLWKNEKLDEAFRYSNKALMLAKQSAYSLGEGTAYNAIGIVYWYKGNYDSAITSFERALPIMNKLNNRKGMASCLNNIGMLHATKGEYPQSLSFFFQALKIHEQQNNTSGMYGCYNNIGIIYKNMKEYDKALSYYFKSLAGDIKEGSELGKAESINNIGVLYDLKGMRDSALYYFNEAVAIHEARNATEGMGSLYINLGVIYFAKKDLEKAELYMKKAIAITESADQKYTSAEAYGALGEVYLQKGKLSQAKTCLDKAYSIAREIDARSIQRDVSLKLSQYYKKTGNANLAYKFLETHLLLKDSLFNAETRESALTMQLQYEYEKKQLKDSVKFEKLNAKKDLELAGQKVELANERTIKYLLYGGILFSIVISLVAFRAYSNKKTANEKIQAQKELIEEQKNIVETKQKEIIDSISYAKRLQDAILPSEKILKHHFPEHFILYKPKDIVAGDFYWFEMVEGIRYIAAADCTGHGVPGAMVSVVCSNALNRALLEFGLRTPGEILDKTRELVLETFSKNDSSVRDGMDVSLCCILPATSDGNYKVMWAGANNPLWYFTEGLFNEIKGHKQPIGKTENISLFPTHEILLKKGDLLYMITDGYGDQFGGPQGKKYKSRKLQATISSIFSTPIDNQKVYLDSTFEKWRNNLEQIDDVTILGIKL